MVEKYSKTFMSENFRANFVQYNYIWGHSSDFLFIINKYNYMLQSLIFNMLVSFIFSKLHIKAHYIIVSNTLPFFIMSYLELCQNYNAKLMQLKYQICFTLLNVRQRHIVFLQSWLNKRVEHFVICQIFG